MIKKTVFGFLSGLFIFSSGLSAAEYPWELKRDEEGIKVYTRKVEGSPIFEFKSETVTGASIEKAVELYEDESRMMKWFHRSKEVRLVKKVSESERLMYFAADLPWPFYDRDGIYRQVKSVDAGAVIYTIQAEPDIYQRRKDRARVFYLDAEWRFTPLPDGGTKIDYRTHTAPGGYVPPAVVNRFVVSLPFKTLLKFRALMEKK